MTKMKKKPQAGGKVLLFLIPFLALASLASFFASFHAVGSRQIDPKSTDFRQTPKSHNGAQCLDFQDGGYLDKLLDEAAVVYLLAVPKAGGSSMAIFVNRCMRTRAGLGFIQNFDFGHGYFYSPSFMDKPTNQAFFVGHAWADMTQSYFQHASTKSLFIISYREETDRLGSAIKHVMKKICQRGLLPSIPKGSMNPPQNRTEGDRVACVIDEKEFVEEIIAKKRGEISGSTFGAYSCQYHDIVEEIMPNLVMISMSQLDDLFGLLNRKYNCPDETVHHVNGFPKNWDHYLRLQNGTEVDINEWLRHNLHHLEFKLKMKDKARASCQGKTKQMGDQIMACPNKAIYNYYRSGDSL